MKKSGVSHGQSASELISKRIAELGDWRGETLSRMRKLIKQADPDVVEEWKWRGTPIWSHDGIICTGESYKNVVKLTFFKGASLKDPARLFNSSLEGNAHRAIDIHEGEEVDEWLGGRQLRSSALPPKQALEAADARRLGSESFTCPPQLKRGPLGGVVLDRVVQWGSFLFIGSTLALLVLNRFEAVNDSSTLERSELLVMGLSVVALPFALAKVVREGDPKSRRNWALLLGL
jgi:hypothetical protein